MIQEMTATIEKAVNQLMADAFPPARDPRSREYKLGVRAVLTRKLLALYETPIFEPGTAQADAFDAGQVEGKIIWRLLLESTRRSLL